MSGLIQLRYFAAGRGRERPQNLGSGFIPDEPNVPIAEHREHAAAVEAVRFVVRPAIVCLPRAIGVSSVKRTQGAEKDARGARLFVSEVRLMSEM